MIRRSSGPLAAISGATRGSCRSHSPMTWTSSLDCRPKWPDCPKVRNRSRSCESNQKLTTLAHVGDVLRGIMRHRDPLKTRSGVEEHSGFAKRRLQRGRPAGRRVQTALPSARSTCRSVVRGESRRIQRENRHRSAPGRILRWTPIRTPPIASRDTDDTRRRSRDVCFRAGRSWQQFRVVHPPFYIRYTPCSRGAGGAFSDAEIASASTIRVSAGSITPSSHNRAVL